VKVEIRDYLQHQARLEEQGDRVVIGDIEVVVSKDRQYVTITIHDQKSLILSSNTARVIAKAIGYLFDA
jgi:hypothetical protein